MDKWFWAYGMSMIWPTAMLLFGPFFLPFDDTRGLDLDGGYNAEDEDLAFYAAMITAAHT